jgi:hypothetical protein
MLRPECFGTPEGRKFDADFDIIAHAGRDYSSHVCEQRGRCIADWRDGEDW